MADEGVAAQFGTAAQADDAGMPSRFSQPKVIGLGLCLILNLVGMVLAGANVSLSLASVLALVLMFGPTFGKKHEIFRVVAISLVFFLSGIFTYHADDAASNKKSGTAAGYSLMIISLWAGSVLCVDFTAFKTRVMQLFVSNLRVCIVAVVFGALNFLGCILFWAGNKKLSGGSMVSIDSELPLSIQALLAFYILVGAMCATGPRWNQISLFVNVTVQFQLLSIAIERSTGNGSNEPFSRKSAVVTAGAVLCWLAHLGFIGINYALTPTIRFEFSLANPVVKSVRMFLLLFCWMWTVIGGAMAHYVIPTLNDGQVAHWASSAMVFTTVVVIIAFAQEPNSAAQFFAQTVAAALLLVVSGRMVGTARLCEENIERERCTRVVVAGLGLQLFFGWCTFLLSMFLDSARIIDIAAAIKANKPKWIGVLAVMLNFLGCMLWWIHLNKSENAAYVSSHYLAVTAFLASAFFVAVFLMDLQQPSLQIFLFFDTAVTVSIMVYVPSTTAELAQLGSSLCWISQLVFCVLVALQCYNDPTQIEGYDGLLDVEKGAEGGDLSYSPPPAYQYEPSNAEESLIDSQHSVAPLHASTDAPADA